MVVEDYVDLFKDESINQAVSFAVRKGISIGYFMGRRVRFSQDLRSSSQSAPLARLVQPFIAPTLQEYRSVCQEVNPFCLDHTYLYTYITRPEFLRNFDLQDEGSCSKLKELIDLLFSGDPGENIKLKHYLATVWNLFRPPCHDFDQHPWSALKTFANQGVGIVGVRPF